LLFLFLGFLPSAVHFVRPLQGGWTRRSRYC
jgi:hypothetical protein